MINYTDTLRRFFHRERLWQLGILLVTPLTAFYLMQFAYSGGFPWQYPLNVVAANYLCIGAVHFALCLMFNYPAVCSLVVHLACCLWGVANHFVSLFRGTPILPWDFTALGTAAAVAGSYRFVPTWQMIVSFLLLGVLVFFLRSRLRKGQLRPTRHNLPARVACLAAAAICFYPVLHPSALGNFGIETDVWDQSGSYQKSGALAVFLRNIRFMEVQGPEGYSVQAVEEILEDTEAPEAPQLGLPQGETPHVVAIMNESWADFEEWGNLSLSESVTDYIRSLDNAIFGHAFTSVFGAGTSASEFEFLTGNSMAFLPSGSIPYQQYILEPTESLASLLKEQGYRTLAFHPGERTSWQRNQAYPRLGFDAFKCVEDMDVSATMEHGYVSDESSFDQIIWEFEHREEGEKLFLFNVTIQNHGAYTVEDYPAQVTITDAPGQYPMAEQYLTLVNKTDEAFEKLVDYFQQLDEPVIVLMFGDHQPSVEEEFLRMAYGLKEGDGLPMEKYMGKFRVPFVIWANYDLPDEQPADSSLNFLGQYLLRYAGLPTSQYGSFLWEMRDWNPALTFVGYTDRAGQAYSHLETNLYTDRIHQYEMVQYNNLFGGEERLDSAFDLPAAPAPSDGGEETPGLDSDESGTGAF